MAVMGYFCALPLRPGPRDLSVSARLELRYCFHRYCRRMPVGKIEYCRAPTILPSLVL